VNKPLEQAPINTLLTRELFVKKVSSRAYRCCPVWWGGGGVATWWEGRGCLKRQYVEEKYGYPPHGNIQKVSYEWRDTYRYIQVLQSMAKYGKVCI